MFPVRKRRFARRQWLKKHRKNKEGGIEAAQFL